MMLSTCSQAVYTIAPGSEQKIVCHVIGTTQLALQCNGQRIEEFEDKKEKRDPATGEERNSCIFLYQILMMNSLTSKLS